MSEDDQGRRASLSLWRRCGDDGSCDPANAPWRTKVRWSSRASRELQGGGGAVLDDLRVQEEILGRSKTAEGARGDGAGGRQNEILEESAVVVTPMGVFDLLEHLEDFLAKPSLVEANRFIMKFFYNLHRRRQESMTARVARHSEALWEASQALRKVQREHGTGGTESWWKTGGGQPGLRTSGRSSPAPSRPFRDDGRLFEEDDEEHDREAQEQDWGWWDWSERGGTQWSEW